MSLFDKWWDAANALDRDKMAALLDDSFVMVRHQTGEQLNKEQFLDYIMTGIREQVTAQNRRLIYENEDIIVSLPYLMVPWAIMRLCWCASLKTERLSGRKLA